MVWDLSYICPHLNKPPRAICNTHLNLFFPFLTLYTILIDIRIYSILSSHADRPLMEDFPQHSHYLRINSSTYCTFMFLKHKGKEYSLFIAGTSCLLAARIRSSRLCFHTLPKENTARLTRSKPSLPLTIRGGCDDAKFSTSSISPLRTLRAASVCPSLRCLQLTHSKSKQLIASDRDTGN